ncbi:helix-turn-helix transcriptional regulator [Marinobacter confluentis]|uniref:LuxR family transcriptional regulator n=1 Tax=Marinobacter confluentis TaxID=1697557 RepID=A0A4Z1C2H9_9GAMM|nr:helix-turn-helix transcriptional regulator [Marinobacter confluentis]TGN41488.1 LuxR family transcriptional regulator [Marinobacter confluentis]
MVQPGKMALRKAQSRIQQLCCMGLGDQIAIPAILRELHDYVPSHANCFFWSDPEGNVRDIYDERPQAPDWLPTYLAEFHNRLDLEVFCGWQNFLRHGTKAVDYDSLLKVDRREYDRHAYYNEMMSQLDFYWGLFMVVRDQKQPLGAVALHRAPKDPRFNADEALRLDQIMPFIAHAFTTPCDPEHQWIDSDDQGLIVTDLRGNIVSASAGGQRLLTMASSDRPWAPVKRGVPPNPPDLLRLLGQRLANVRRGTPDSFAPSGAIQNAWGRFVFRADWLYPHNDAGETIAISIRRQEPMPLKLIRHIKHLPLSSKQAEVCLLMATGQSYNQIAEQQSMKRSTAISHAREIYARLDVHNREQLVAKLLTPHVMVQGEHRF